jgi:uracil-DNA glycosylase
VAVGRGQATGERGGARAEPEPPDKISRLREVHRDIAAFRPRGFGPPVHGAAVASRIFLLGQAPGPHEARFGRPFAWTAGKTLFRWLERATGAGEETVRERVYISAVVRCFPGKTAGGGDRVPSAEECALWRGFVEREVEILRPRLVVPVGRLAIQEVLGHAGPIAAVVGREVHVRFHGVETDVIPLPHPSGASTWFKMEPGRTLLDEALRLVADHPEVVRTFPLPSPAARGRGGPGTSGRRR